MSETAGRRPWLLFAFKISLWLLVGLFVYSVVTAIGSVPGEHVVGQVLAVVIGPCLLMLGLWFMLSLLPAPVGQSVRKVMKYVVKLLGLAIVGLLKLVWRTLR